jgi:hypothetical protein
LRPARQEFAGEQQVPPLRASELLAWRSQEQAQELHAPQTAHELVASPLLAPVASEALAQEPQAFAVKPSPLLPWPRDLLRLLPQHRRHPSNDDELFRQLRR